MGGPFILPFCQNSRWRLFEPILQFFNYIFAYNGARNQFLMSKPRFWGMRNPIEIF